jgi:hypothetical protein
MALALAWFVSSRAEQSRAEQSDRRGGGGGGGGGGGREKRRRIPAATGWFWATRKIMDLLIWA